MWDASLVEARLAARIVAEPDPAPERRAAVAIVLRLAETPDVLLMKRVEHDGDPWSGQISLPGGGREPEDVDLFATAVRETREEVGIDLARHGRPLGRLTPIHARARGRLLAMDVSPFVFELTGAVEPVVGEEAREAFWFPIDAALRGDLDRPFPYDHDGVIHELPSWHYEGRVVWGMTHRIVSTLLATLR